ncbi:MAG: SDR family NAD(P)-dependent oxidoreductase, partial [Rhodospirillaceae bacterium]|nr:SDR family NAD(P)-dependent oxidoreductase [Rhodospirillaceae bacterium]
MSERLKNKVAIVTGAGSVGPGWGNGKATATLFAREGAKVFAIDRNEDAVAETASIIAEEGGACTAHVADVTEAEAVEALVARCVETYGRVDVLHNNVGIVDDKNVLETSEETWDQVMAVNLKSMFLTCKHVIPVMGKQGGG